MSSEAQGGGEMGKRYTVVQSRTRPDGQVFHVVVGPGGEINVKEESGGNLSGSIRSGYVGDEKRAVARAIEAVRELREQSGREPDLDET
jgi:hypothetical protein